MLKSPMTNLSLCMLSLAIANALPPPSTHSIPATQASSSRSTGGESLCELLTIPVNITTNATKFDLDPTSQAEVTQIIQDLASVNSTFVAEHTVGTQIVSGIFNIGAQLCHPSTSTDAKKGAIQLLTHGLGLNRHYWDVARGYSYVDAATKAGYATLSYDRIGVGASEHPDGINTVQSSLGVEVLHALITHLKAGKVTDTVYDHVACVAHSYGSVLQARHDALYPADCAAIIATGISDTMDALPDTLLSEDLTIASHIIASFEDLSNAYTIAPSPVSFQQSLLLYPFFEEKIADASFEAVRDVWALGDVLTLNGDTVPAKEVTAPVLVLDGLRDFTACGGDCTQPYDRAEGYSWMIYPGASKRRTVLVPEVGHGINLQSNAGSAFESMLAFLKGCGL
ncbi:MAG: hypothetical protein Q9162_006469 [Coniocarpon cinnabarinum]